LTLGRKKLVKIHIHCKISLCESWKRKNVQQDWQFVKSVLFVWKWNAQPTSASLVRNIIALQFAISSKRLVGYYAKPCFRDCYVRTDTSLVSNWWNIFLQEKTAVCRGRDAKENTSLHILWLVWWIGFSC